MRKPKVQWGEESIRVEQRKPSVSDENENRKVAEACHSEFGEVRLRINVGAYGPGTVSKPTPRYWWMAGESATVICKTPEVAEWFRAELCAFLDGLDMVVLEEPE